MHEISNDVGVLCSDVERAVIEIAEKWQLVHDKKPRANSKAI